MAKAPKEKILLSRKSSKLPWRRVTDLVSPLQFFGRVLKAHELGRPNMQEDDGFEIDG